MIRIATATLVLLILAVACGGGDSSGRPTPSAEEERVLALIAEERAYVEAITPVAESEEEATNRHYLNRLEIFELGVMTSTNVVHDICSAGLPVEREALAAAQAEQAGPSIWDRYEPLLDEIEAFLCPDSASP